MDLDEYLLTRKGYVSKLKTEQAFLRFQTALICEALIGGGKGAKFVNDAWTLEERKKLTAEDVKEKLKKARELMALKKLK
jgi:hypothetical protein